MTVLYLFINCSPKPDGTPSLSRRQLCHSSASTRWNWAPRSVSARWLLSWLVLGKWQRAVWSRLQCCGRRGQQLRYRGLFARYTQYHRVVMMIELDVSLLLYFSILPCFGHFDRWLCNRLLRMYQNYQDVRPQHRYFPCNTSMSSSEHRDWSHSWKPSSSIGWDVGHLAISHSKLYRIDVGSHRLIFWMRCGYLRILRGRESRTRLFRWTCILCGLNSRPNILGSHNPNFCPAI